MLQIKDETAGVLLLTIDNTGLICFGNGTPVTQLTINGTGVIDSNGRITNQRVNSGSLAMSTGTVTVQPGQTASVTTLSGVSPTVQLDTSYPSQKATYIPTNGSVAAHCQFDSLPAFPVHSVNSVTLGGFSVLNHCQPDDQGLCTLTVSMTATYRWI